MKKLLSLLAAVGVMFALSSCGDDDDPVADNGVTITGIPATAEIDNLGTLGPVTATVTGDDGLVDLVITKNGTAIETVALSGTSATYDFSYTATAEDEDSNIVFTFTASDTDSDFETVTHVLSVGAAESFPNEVLSGIIDSDLTLTNDRIWELAGRVIVKDAELTIEPGTIIKGRPGDAAAASVLIIARGATIQANGTAANPIVFTSTDDGIQVGQFESTLDLKTQQGLWGGVLILGSAPISADAAEVQIEGIPTSVTEGLYGGMDASDDSGNFEYVSIRFTGAELGPGNELQGLTLGGVGSGTVINHVESINSSDDGIEIFGGSVNISNFIVWAQDDDGFDADQGWTGTVDNFVYIGAADDYGWNSDHALELDGSEGDDGDEDLVGSFINGSARGLNSSDFADLRDGAKYDLQDIYFFDFTADRDIELDADGSVDPNDEDSNLSDDDRISTNYADGVVVLEGLEFITTNVIGDIFVDKLDAELAAVVGTQTQSEYEAQIAANEAKFAADNSIVTTPTVGADVTVLAWSYTAVSGQLDSFQ